MASLHIICNSHIDPIWLWRRSSGKTSWLNTVHSTVRIMDEQPDVKFSCSSTALYRWIEQVDPGLFRRLRELVNEKRWEIVGGWEVQSDALISRPETLRRQAVYGKAYILDRFGVDVRIGYNVDSFGHSAGLPDILRQSGIDSYVFVRADNVKPLLFEWRSASGASVTGLRVFGGYNNSPTMTRSDLFTQIEEHLATGLSRQTMFFGLGDHGGGLSRIHLGYLREAQQKYDIEFSTLAEYFEAVKGYELPVVTGELTGPRGVYSIHHEVKSKVARSTQLLLKAEKLTSHPSELDDAWLELLFHHFHDILPGSSIREAFELDVIPGLGMVEHTANQVIDRELSRRGMKLDTSFLSEGGVTVWNPHSFPVRSVIAFDAFADPNQTGSPFNLLRNANGQTLPLQFLPAESTYGPFGTPWGKLTAVLDLPPNGELLYAYGRGDQIYPNLGFELQRALLKNLTVEILFDDARTWGFGQTGFKQRIGQAEITTISEYVDGPVCSILRVEFRFQNSNIIMDLYRYRGIAETGVKLRQDWHEINCCVKLALRHGLANHRFLTNSCGAIVERDFSGQEPEEYSMIDWCAAATENRMTGFLSADLHSCDHADGKLRLTLIRPTFYADHPPFEPNRYSGSLDLGLSWRNFWIFDSPDADLEKLAEIAQARLVPLESREVTTRCQTN